MPGYKLPICWLGQPMTNLVFSLSGETDDKFVTEDMVNPGCHCFNPMQAHFCMEGHLTECHAGMTCDEAECSHWEATQEEEGGLFDESDL